jgi:succinylglutamate desuccinylase
MPHSLHVEEDPAIQGVTRIARTPDWPRPWVLVIGSIHGDEPCGREAIASLVADARAGALALTRGTLVTLHGNPAASKEGTRCSAGGLDLNRLFDFRFVDELSEARWTPEHRRALALRPLVEQADVGVDLHSARAVTPPFAIAMSAKGSLDLALALGVPYVTTGWNGPGLLEHQVALTLLSRRGKPGVAVECGSHDEPHAAETARRIIDRMLRALDLIEDEVPRPSAPSVVLRLMDAIKRPSPTFRFTRPLSGLERLLPGERIGGDANVEIRMRSECYALMPNDSVPVGEDMLYLARPP